MREAISLWLHQKVVPEHAMSKERPGKRSVAIETSQARDDIEEARGQGESVSEPESASVSPDESLRSKSKSTPTKPSPAKKRGPKRYKQTAGLTAPQLKPMTRQLDQLVDCAARNVTSFEKCVRGVDTNLASFSHRIDALTSKCNIMEKKLTSLVTSVESLVTSVKELVDAKDAGPVEVSNVAGQDGSDGSGGPRGERAKRRESRKRDHASTDSRAANALDQRKTADNPKLPSQPKKKPRKQ